MASKDDKMAKMKIVGAGAALVVAALLLAQNFGLIELWGGTPKPPPPTPQQAEEVKKVVEQRNQQIEERVKQGAVKAGG